MADLAIDLATLGDENRALTRRPVTDLESLGSEDEGPPDFTLNLEKWMRGTEKWKKGGGRIEDDQDDDGSPSNEGMGSEGDEMTDEERGRGELAEESEFMPLGTSTPAPYVAPRENGPKPTNTLDNRSLVHRPSPRLDTEVAHTKPTQDIADPTAALQAKIERLQMEHGNHQLVKESMQAENSKLRDEINELRDKLSEMQSTLAKMQQEAKIAEKEWERQSREEAKSKVGFLRNKFEPVFQELAIVRSTAEAEKRHFEGKMTTLEAKLWSSQESLTKQQAEAQHVQAVKNSENLMLRSELDMCKGEVKAYQQTLQTREEDHIAALAILNKKLDAAHESQSRADVLKMELDHANEQLRETRRIVSTIEDENDRLTRENERQREELNATTAVVGSKDASIAAAKSTIEDLRGEISRIKGEKNIGLIEEDVHDAELERLRQQHQANMQAAQTAHDQQLKGLKATILRADEGMRRRETRLQKNHREEIAALNQEMSTLKARLQKSHREEVSALNQEISTLQGRLKTMTGPPPATTAELRNAIRMLSSKLTTANETILTTRHALAAAHKSLAVRTSEAERLEKEFDACKVAIKKHYREVLQKRETESKKKIDALSKEREKLVKTLFLTWGQMEMGVAPDGQKQPYRYMFYNKNGERIQPAGEKSKGKDKDAAVKTNVSAGASASENVKATTKADVKATTKTDIKATTKADVKTATKTDIKATTKSAHTKA
jgi:predicted  nucleic acid-binding Zn-ribbon protein